MKHEHLKILKSKKMSNPLTSKDNDKLIMSKIKIYKRDDTQ